MRLKFISHLLLFIPLFFLIAKHGHAEDIFILSLEDVLELVEKESLETLLNREGIVQAMAIVGRERAGVLPQVNFEISQARRFSSNSSRSGSYPESDAGFSGTVPLFDPQLRGAYQAAKVGLQISENEYRLLMEELLSVATFLFLTHLRNHEQLAVIEANLALGESLLTLAERQFEAGLASRIDVTRAEVQLASFELRLIQQRAAVHETEIQLKRLLNLDFDLPLDVTLFRAERELSSAMKISEPEAIVADHPLFLRVQSIFQQRQVERDTARMGRLPSVFAYGDYGRLGRRPFDNSSTYSWTVGVIARVPIFDGARNRSDQMLAQSRLRTSEIELQLARRDIISELSIALKNLESRLSQLDVAEKGLQLSEEELRLARISFESGTVDNREIIDAQRGLADARNNLVEALYLYNLSHLDYAWSSGNTASILQSMPQY